MDIVVKDQDGYTSLVVDTKQRADLGEATTHLADYMKRIGVDLGLLVTPQRLLILREDYRGDLGAKVIGDYPLALGGEALDPVAFEDFVQRWLESLAWKPIDRSTPLTQALTDIVVPVVKYGTIRAAHLRVRSAAG